MIVLKEPLWTIAPKITTLLVLSVGVVWNEDTKQGLI